MVGANEKKGGKRLEGSKGGYGKECRGNGREGKKSLERVSEKEKERERD